MHHKRTPTKAGVSRQRQYSRTRAYRWATSLVAVATVIGGGIAIAAPASAAPTDPITMPDVALRACINADLGQGATDPITEAQAATVTTVDCQNAGVTSLTGMEHFTAVETAWFAVNGGITDLTSLSGLTTIESLDLRATGIADDDMPSLYQLANLRSLSIGGNGITDVSVLSNFSSLTQLGVGGNDISDVSALAGLIDLRRLYLFENGITDVSPLAGLTNLTNLDLRDQTVSLSSAPMNSPTTNPVVDPDGIRVPAMSSDSGFSYDSAAHTWTFTTQGNKSLAWNTPVTIGTASNVEFSGTISQRISFAQAMPEDPTVTQAVCVNGDVVYPQITLPDTEGIHYTIVGDVAPGETVTIEAVPADEDHAIYVDPASDWVDASGDHIYATLEVTLDEAGCEIVDPDPTMIDPPNGDLPVNDTCGPDNAVWLLPTGDDVSEGFTWRVAEDGLLTAEANEGYVFGDVTDDLDPMIREYGYAPDSGEVCPATLETPETPDKLAATGGTAPPILGGAAAALLLGSGMFLLLTRRNPRDT